MLDSRVNPAVSQPVSVGSIFRGSLNVALAANGSIVEAREIGRPVLCAAPGAMADVHVGQRIPVKLASSSITNQTTTNIGSTIQYVQTGTQVNLSAKRVSVTQVRLNGRVSLSQQTATVDGVPSTAERALSVDHLVTLDSWTMLGRLDSASEKTSRGWLSLGKLLATADETFVVCGRVVQVHRDERTHGVPADGAAKVTERVLGPVDAQVKPAILKTEPVKIKEEKPDALPEPDKKAAVVKP